MNTLRYLKNIDAKSIDEEIKLAHDIIDHFLFKNTIVSDEHVVDIVEYYEKYTAELKDLLDII